MKYSIVILLLSILAACNTETGNKSNAQAASINDKFYLELGGAQQYIEIISTSKDNPVLLFVHGGPAWPQTPQIRYFNSELADKYTLVIWEQRGAGKSYKKNPSPKDLSLTQIVSDGNELADWLKKKYQQEKIYLAGYSWGSLVAVNMVKEHPENYKAYIGIAQFINKDEGMKISRNWLREQALEKDNQAALKKIDSLENRTFFKDDHDRFVQQYLLVNAFGGALHNKDAIPEIEKAVNQYEDYQGYDWEGVWAASAAVLQKEFYVADVRNIKTLDIPVILFQGKHDWNVPSVLAAAWLHDLEAPKKEIIWFENSGHGPLEEEPKAFNEAMLSILDETR